MPLPPRAKHVRAPSPRPAPERPVAAWADEDEQDVGDLPGSNLYDRLVVDGIHTYKDAIDREGSALKAEQVALVRTQREAAQIDLETKKLAHQVQRDELVPRGTHIARTEALILAFNELLRMSINECMQKVPQTIRDDYTQTMTNRADAGLAAIADCLERRASREETEAALMAVFNQDTP